MRAGRGQALPLRPRRGQAAPCGLAVGNRRGPGRSRRLPSRGASAVVGLAVGGRHYMGSPPWGLAMASHPSSLPSL
ncbi:hypothetical protein GW17_00034524 [Ensete ventricosum]|uniref:Uncharacterized protein n=1 Tax=Ensete ventricosum TaxID=4639 RepID=A0A444DW75_ENSVE|nr:hypothetical protein GW17_00034524 [Ensete ventricosum]RZR73198.1 hypothetical protein BHM03_00021340 [Ensete ventricosum]